MARSVFFLPILLATIVFMSSMLVVNAVPIANPPGLQVAYNRSTWQQLFDVNADQLISDHTFRLERISIPEFSTSETATATSINISNPVAELSNPVSPKAGSFLRCEYRTNNLLFDLIFDVTYSSGTGTFHESKVTLSIDIQSSFSVAVMLTHKGVYSPTFMFPRVRNINEWSARWENHAFPESLRRKFAEAFIAEFGTSVGTTVSLNIAQTMQFNIIRTLNNVNVVHEYPLAPVGFTDLRATDIAFHVNNQTGVFSYNGDNTGLSHRSSWNVERHAVPTPQGQSPLEVILDTFFLNSRLKTLQNDFASAYRYTFLVKDFAKSWPQLLEHFPSDRPLEIFIGHRPREDKNYHKVSTLNGRAHLKMEFEIEVSVIMGGGYPYPVTVLTTNSSVDVTLAFKLGPHTRNEADKDVHFPLHFALHLSTTGDSLVGHEYTEIQKNLPFDSSRFESLFLAEFFQRKVYDRFLDEEFFQPLPLPIPAGFNPQNLKVEVGDEFIHLKSDVKVVRAH